MLFFLTATASTALSTLSLHDALPIYSAGGEPAPDFVPQQRRDLIADNAVEHPSRLLRIQDRKSTRLNSSHTVISYAVFCLKKKKTNELSTTIDTSFTRSAYRLTYSSP